LGRSVGTRRIHGIECEAAILVPFPEILGDLLANDNESGPAIVTISPSDNGFQSRGCGTCLGGQLKTGNLWTAQIGNFLAGHLLADSHTDCLDWHGRADGDDPPNIAAINGHNQIKREHRALAISSAWRFPLLSRSRPSGILRKPPNQ
jgi:hypothetical protein